MPSSAKEHENRSPERAIKSFSPYAAGSSSGPSQASHGVAASCEIPVEVHGSQKGGHAVSHRHTFPRRNANGDCVPARLRVAPVNEGRRRADAGADESEYAAGMLSRVTHVRSYPNLKSYVEVEFTKVDPGFWSIDFAEESAAQGYMPARSNAQPGSTKSEDFWGSEREHAESGSPALLARRYQEPRTSGRDSYARSTNSNRPAPLQRAHRGRETISAPPPAMPAAKAPEFPIAAAGE